jgi:pimeloyl-ACP methyl ester carboxylesterase
MTVLQICLAPLLFAMLPAQAHVAAAHSAVVGAHTVIAPDLRGIGASERTVGGYDKKTMAGHEQVRRGFGRLMFQMKQRRSLEPYGCDWRRLD